MIKPTKVKLENGGTAMLEMSISFQDQYFYRIGRGGIVGIVKETLIAPMQVYFWLKAGRVYKPVADVALDGHQKEIPGTIKMIVYDRGNAKFDIQK